MRQGVGALSDGAPPGTLPSQSSCRNLSLCTTQGAMSLRLCGRIPLVLSQQLRQFWPLAALSFDRRFFYE
jgi:hypothetical protein